MKKYAVIVDSAPPHIDALSMVIPKDLFHFRMTAHSKQRQNHTVIVSSLLHADALFTGLTQFVKGSILL